ncbi:MAG: cupin domain-containing protein [Cellvibrionales bacterium]|nr:cupin domain-containing protein [Cellvibrionales bacterium]
MDSAQCLINALGLTPHIEGGFYRRTFTSAQWVDVEESQRPLATSIYYLLTEASPVGFFHKNASDILHLYHGEGVITHYTLSPEGVFDVTQLGADIASGQQLQFFVPKNYWKASQLTSGQFGLISEVVLPGFDWSGHQLATLDELVALNPMHQALYASLTKPLLE